MLLSVLLLLVLIKESSAIEIPQAWAEYIKGLLDKYEKTSRLHNICTNIYNLCFMVHYI